MKRYFKGAIVILLSIVVFFSSIVIADIKINETKTGNKDDIIVWDNDMGYNGFHAAQWDEEMEFDCYLADDFQTDVIVQVKDVHWIGGYWGEDYQSGDFNWSISFMNDDGTGEEPDSHPQNPSHAGPFNYTWDEIEKTLLQDTGDTSVFELSVYLPETVVFKSKKYWISIWGNGEYPTQSGWGYHFEPIILNPAVFRSDFYRHYYWRPGYEVHGFYYDMCFQLTECEADIDVEKYVMDPKNQEWVDADEEATALDLPICNNAEFKIVIRNTGEVDLNDIIVKDKMHESLKFITGEPLPDQWYYESPFYYLEWLISGPIEPSDTFEIFITAHVEGPACSFDSNYVYIETEGCG